MQFSLRSFNIWAEEDPLGGYFWPAGRKLETPDLSYQTNLKKKKKFDKSRMKFDKNQS